MKLVLNTLFCGLLFLACANNAEQVKKDITAPETAVDSSTIVDVQGQIAFDPVTADQEEEESETPINEAPVQIQTIEEDKNEGPRTGSTIAQQQEAARRIQNELANRSPMPNEESNQEGAVFQKVVSTQNKKETPKPSTASTAKKAVPKKPTKKKTYPAIEFKEMQMAFDTITEGDVFDHKFVFTNTGNAPLEIKSAKATCGCTQPSFPFIPIEPNEQGHISVRYNSVGKDGHQKPEVSVLTNINNKEIILYLEGFVVQKEKEEEGK